MGLESRNLVECPFVELRLNVLSDSLNFFVLIALVFHVI